MNILLYLKGTLSLLAFVYSVAALVVLIALYATDVKNEDCVFPRYNGALSEEEGYSEDTIQKLAHIKTGVILTGVLALMLAVAFLQ